MIASVIIIHLLLTRQVLGLYETIWNAYFEQPCCEKDFMKFHRGKREREREIIITRVQLK